MSGEYGIYTQGAWTTYVSLVLIWVTSKVEPSTLMQYVNSASESHNYKMSESASCMRHLAISNTVSLLLIWVTSKVEPSTLSLCMNSASESDSYKMSESDSFPSGPPEI